jgi:hypothetical protein
MTLRLVKSVIRALPVALLVALTVPPERPVAVP